MVSNEVSACNVGNLIYNLDHQPLYGLMPIKSAGTHDS